MREDRILNRKCIEKLKEKKVVGVTVTQRFQSSFLKKKRTPIYRWIMIHTNLLLEFYQIWS
jgi:hypothetical protein